MWMCLCMIFEEEQQEGLLSEVNAEKVVGVT